MAMEYQLSTAKAREELRALEAAAQRVDQAFQESSRSVDASMGRMSQATAGVRPVSPGVAESVRGVGQAAQQASAHAAGVNNLGRSLGALSSVNLGGLAASVSNFAGALNTVVIPSAFAALGSMASGVAAQFSSAGAAIGSALGSITAGLSRLAAAAGPVGIALTAVTVALGAGVLLGFSSSIQDATAVYEKFRATIVATTGSQQQAVEQWNFVRNLAKGTATDINEVAKSYARFSIGAQQSGMSLQTTQDIFQKLSSTFRVFQLDAKSSGLAFKAFEQMLSKGRVGAEELKAQLGDHLPGALGSMAKAVGVGKGELLRMMEAGKLGTDSISKMADQLYSDYGSKVPEALKTASAQFQNLSNTMTILKQQFGVGFNQDMVPALKNLIALLDSSAIESFAAAWGRLSGAMGGAFLSSITAIPNAFGVVFSAIGPIVGLINSGLILAFEGLTYGLNAVSSVLGYVQGLFNSFWSAVGSGLQYAWQFVNVIGGDLADALSSAWDWLSKNEYVLNALANSWTFVTGAIQPFATALYYIISIPFLLFLDNIKDAFTRVSAVIKDVIDWFMKLPGVAAVVEYLGSVIGRVKERLDEKSEAAKRAVTNNQSLGSSMDDASKKAGKLAGEVMGVVDALGALASAGYAGKSLADFGVAGFDDDGPDLKRMKELEKQFDADYKKSAQEGAAKKPSAKNAGPPDTQMDTESYAQWAKRLYGVDVLSGKTAEGRDMNDKSMYDAHGQKVQYNTEAIKQAINAFEQNTGALQSNAESLVASNDNISTLATSVDGVGTGVVGLQDAVNTNNAALERNSASTEAFGDSVDGVNESVSALSEGVDELGIDFEDNAEFLSDNTEQLGENTTALVDQTDATSDLESATEYNTDANYYAGDAANAMADAASSLEGSMDAAAQAFTSSGSGGGDGSGNSMPGNDPGQGAENIEASSFAKGGISHKGKHKKTVPLSAFSKAPRFADGGIPSILHPDEAVIPLAGGAVPVTMSGGGGGMSTGLLVAIGESLRLLHQDFKDTQLLMNNGHTLAHNDAVKTHQYLQMLQDLEVEQTKLISQMISSFEALGIKLLDNLNKLESLIQAQAAARASGGGGGARDFTASSRTAGSMSPVNFNPNKAGMWGFAGTAAGYATEWDEELQTRVVKRDRNGKPISIVRNTGNVVQSTANMGSKGGFADGSPNAWKDMMGGFQATLHPDEAVVPLPDGRSIPLDFDEEGMADRMLARMGGGRQGPTVIVNMTVNTADAGSFNKSKDQIMRDLDTDMRRSVERLGRGLTVDDPTRRRSGT